MSNTDPRIVIRSFVSAPEIGQLAGDLFQEFFSWRLERSPEFGTQLGLGDGESELGEEYQQTTVI